MVGLIFLKQAGDAKTVAAGGSEYSSTIVYDDNFKTYVSSMTNRVGHYGEIDYDDLMRPFKITDANGVYSNIEYDDFSRVVASIAPGDDATYPTERKEYSDTRAPEAFP